MAGQMINTGLFYFVSCMQTRSLLGVFEEDTAAISNYCTQLYQAMQRIYDAQVHTHTIHRCSATGFAGMGRTYRNVNEWQLIEMCVSSCSVLSAVFLFKNELSAATHLTSRLLKEYDKQVGQVIPATGLMTPATTL